jgi:hypothetical protein
MGKPYILCGKETTSEYMCWMIDVYYYLLQWWNCELTLITYTVLQWHCTLNFQVLIWNVSFCWVWCCIIGWSWHLIWKFYHAVVPSIDFWFLIVDICTTDYFRHKNIACFHFVHVKLNKVHVCGLWTSCDLKCKRLLEYIILSLSSWLAGWLRHLVCHRGPVNQ